MQDHHRGKKTVTSGTRMNERLLMVDTLPRNDLVLPRGSSDAIRNPRGRPLEGSKPCSTDVLDDCYRRYRRYFVAMVSRRFRVSWADAEDIVQDAFTLAVLKAEQIQCPAAWIRATVERLSIGQSRLRSRRASAALGIGMPRVALLPQQFPPCDRIPDALCEIFGSSADFAREMLVEGQTLRAVADRVGVPEGTIYNRISTLRRHRKIQRASGAFGGIPGMSE